MRNGDPEPFDVDEASVRSAFRWEIPEYYNIALDTCERHAADKGRVAIIFDRGDGSHEKWTYFELKRVSDRLANVLRGLGVGVGDRVAVLLSQCPQLPMAHLATYKLGAIAVPLFTLFGPDSLQHRINDSGARVLLTDLAHLPIILDLRRELPDLQHVIAADGMQPGVHSLPDLLTRASDTLEPVLTRAEDPAVILYTSGTTGPSKGALHAHRVLLGHLPGVSIPHNLMPKPGDLFWTPADWAWIGGLFNVLFPAMHWGIPVLARRMGKFDPDEAFRLMADWEVANAFLPPTAIRMMQQSSARNRQGLRLRSVASAGEPLGVEALAWGYEAFGVQINEFYGQTECNLVLGNSHALYPVRPGSMGRAIPGHDVAVIDADGQITPRGQIGELAVRRPDPAMFLGYWRRDEATQGRFRGERLRTGDLVTLDEQGYFTFVGRADDMISSGGYRIGPAEVEETLMRHPAVLMAAAVGIPDPLRGQIVKAFIVLRSGVTGSDKLAVELQHWVRERLGAHEYPREVEFLRELPMTPSGKVVRAALRRRGTSHEAMEPAREV